MAAGWALVAEVDVAEPRVGLGSMVVCAGGNPDKSGWDGIISDNVWRDPARRWVMPIPLPAHANWRTTTTGDYARLSKADYTLTTAAAWIDNPRGIAGNTYLEGNGTNERVTSTASYSADAAWYVSVYIPGAGSLAEQTVLQFGMGTFGGSSTIYLNVRANGAIAVYKGADQIGYSDLDFAQSKQQSGNTVAQSTLSFMVIPIRPYMRNGTTKSDKGELLIVTDGGTAFVVDFEGLGSGDHITPSGVIWWTVPQGRPSVQVAPCKFVSAGTLYGPSVEMRYPPDNPRVFTATVWGADVGGAGGTAVATLVGATSLSGYSPDGTTTKVRVKVVMTGACAVAAVDCYMPPTQVNTASSPVNILPAIELMTLSVDDWKQGGAARLKLTARLSNLLAAGMVHPDTMLERPIRLGLRDVDAGSPVTIDFFRGVLCLDLQDTAQGLAYPTGADMLTFTGFDRGWEAARASYLDSVAFDGRTLRAAVEAQLLDVGFDAATYVYGSTSTYTIPISDPVQGKWTLLPDRGSPVGASIQKTFEDHGADWWRGWVPTTGGYKFRILSPSDLVGTAVIELFHSRTDARAAGFAESVVAYRVVYATTREEIPPEANQIIVIGQTITGARKLILAQSNDVGAQNPATAVASRSVTWVGRVQRVIEINPGITTQTQADDLDTILNDRLGVIRHIVNIESPMLVIAANTRPLWTGDVVKLWAPGRGTYELLRITGIPEIAFTRDFSQTNVHAGSRPIRRGKYRTERIGSG